MLSPTVVFLAICFAGANAQRCKTLSSDASWPSESTWDTFNQTVDGRLIRTDPFGAPCDTAPDTCITDSYTQYAVNVSTPVHVISTVKFVKEHNIRFLVRNTGHDYMGKSTGQGALSVWTHYLKSTEFIDDYEDTSYKGPALKASAGMQVHETYKAASALGYAVVGGDCPTVGLAGGYIPGGGHGPLAGKYGLAADQTLSFEVITTDGLFTTASPTQNADLYWALSGGGAGTYAIVWSVTVKVHRDLPVTAAAISFAAGGNITLDTWYSAYNFYQSEIPKYTAAGGWVTTLVGAGIFTLNPAYFVNTTSEAITSVFQPLMDFLTNAGIPFASSFTAFPVLLQAYESDFPAGEDGPLDPETNSKTFLGGRLLGGDLWESEERFNEMTGVVRSVLDSGLGILDVSFNPSLAKASRASGDNAVLPAWRNSQRLMITAFPSSPNSTQEEIDENRQKLTSFGETLTKLTPGSGSYLNEANILDPDWKNAFYGENYDKLLEIKQKWDPSALLYGSTAVGGDLWKLNENGALCSV